MDCETCLTGGHSRLRCCDGKWVCRDCVPTPLPADDKFNFLVVPTVHYKNYFKNGGNVSAARVKMVKSRCLAPHGKGEVVLKGISGKPTDRLASNY